MNSSDLHQQHHTPLSLYHYILAGELSSPSQLCATSNNLILSLLYTFTLIQWQIFAWWTFGEPHELLNVSHTITTGESNGRKAKMKTTIWWIHRVKIEFFLSRRNEKFMPERTSWKSFLHLNLHWYIRLVYTHTKHTKTYAFIQVLLILFPERTKISGKQKLLFAEVIFLCISCVCVHVLVRLLLLCSKSGSQILR